MTATERQRKELQDRKEAAREKTAKKIDPPIITKPTLLTTDDVIDGMLKSIGKVDLIRTLQNDLKDPLLKYTDEDGNVATFKVPMNLYIVSPEKPTSKLRLNFTIPNSTTP